MAISLRTAVYVIGCLYLVTCMWFLFILDDAQWRNEGRAEEGEIKEPPPQDAGIVQSNHHKDAQWRNEGSAEKGVNKGPPPQDDGHSNQHKDAQWKNGVRKAKERNREPPQDDGQVQPDQFELEQQVKNMVAFTEDTPPPTTETTTTRSTFGLSHRNATHVVAKEFSLDELQFETVVTEACLQGRRTWPVLPVSDNRHGNNRHGNRPHSNGPSNGRSNTTSCNQPHFSRVSLPRTALASFPGCGNTWARHLIQQLTGVWSGSLYRDADILAGGFLGEGVDNSSVVVIKTHWPYVKPNASAVEHYPRTVLVLRSPQECLLAEFHRRYSNTHTGLAPPELFNGDTWTRYLGPNAERWMWFYQTWLKKNTCTFILDFQRLKSNLAYELRQLAKFLGVRDEGLEDRIKCILNDSDGSFKRKKSKTLSVFSSSQKKQVDYYGSTLAKLVEQKASYRPIFSW